MRNHHDDVDIGEAMLHAQRSNVGREGIHRRVSLLDRIERL